MSDFLQQRKNLVEKLKAEGIRDKEVLRAIEKVERHKFIEENLQKFAYEDKPLEIGFNQTISQPYIVGYMLQSLDLKGIERVLEIGTGSGYQAAVLAEICMEVYSIEAISELENHAKKMLQNLGYTNIYTKYDTSHQAFKDKAPFDAIIATAVAKKVPQSLISQLKIGGVLVMPIEENNVQILVKIVKTAENLYSTKKLIAVRFVPMVGNNP
jgi:protein-L-isoaspartate(D-aspartate) O-methyltransferase